jgi:UDP-glucuronate 4-epimerase
LSRTVAVSGAAGFIGAHVCRALLARGDCVVGIDSLNGYYDPALKRARLDWIAEGPGAGRFRFNEGDIADPETARVWLREARHVVHLAAQAGVRYALEAPFAYAHANLTGHLSVLEACRARGADLDHLVYASSSSVYGERGGGPFREEDAGEAPASLYAATKRADEMMSASYASMFGVPQSGLRFFTVYGPWGRPDMAYWIFTKALFEDRALPIFGTGEVRRDFTYIDDIVAGVLAVLDAPPEAGGHRVFNIGNRQPESLRDLIAILERETGRTARFDLKPSVQGDVSITYADISRIEALTGWRPKTSLAEGLARFVSWYRTRFAV